MNRVVVANADIPAIRAALREMYQRIEKMDWADMLVGSIQTMGRARKKNGGQGRS